MHRALTSALTSLTSFVALAACFAACLVACIAAPGGAGAATSRMSPTEASYAHSVFVQLNDERAAHGLPRLRKSWTLTQAAHTHNLAMSRSNEISHRLSGERDFVARDRAAGWRPQCDGGENVGVNSRLNRDAATQLESIMYGEVAPYDGHRRNILDTDYTNVGVAVKLDPQNGRLWLTTDFGQRRC